MSGSRGGDSGPLDPSADIPVVALRSCRCGPRAFAAVPARARAGTVAGPEVPGGVGRDGLTAAELRSELQRGLTNNAGIVRDAAGLLAASSLLARLQSELAAGPVGFAWAELRNLVDVGSALVEAATAREESRGAHTRADFAATSDRFRVRLRHRGG